MAPRIKTPVRTLDRAGSERDARLSGLGNRLTSVLGRPWLLWTLVGIFALRALLFAALEPSRPDTGTFWAGARALLSHPGDLYALSSAAIAHTHWTPLPGGLGGFISPPTVAFLFVPLAGLDRGAATAVWALVDAACVIGGLFLIQRRLRPAGAAAPLFWLAAVFYQPLFAELDAGQIGGPLLLLAGTSIALYERRPALAGAAAGLGASLKLYPAAMALGAIPERRWRYALALAGTAAVALALAFVPLGPGAPLAYLRDILLPTLSPANPDCAMVSVRSMVARYAGGQAWAVPGSGPHGLDILQTPWAFPGAVGPLVLLIVALMAGVGVWAAWRSGEPAYAMAVGFAMGAVIPGVVWPYQLLPLLPLVLVVLVREVGAGRAAIPILIGVAMLIMVRPPCGLPLANTWTLAALALYSICLAAAGRQSSILETGGAPTKQRR